MMARTKGWLMGLSLLTLLGCGDDGQDENCDDTAGRKSIAAQFSPTQADADANEGVKGREKGKGKEKDKCRGCLPGTDDDSDSESDRRSGKNDACAGRPFEELFEDGGKGPDSDSDSDSDSKSKTGLEG